RGILRVTVPSGSLEAARFIDSISFFTVRAPDDPDRPPAPPSGPIPKFVSYCGTLVYELRNLRTTSNSIILVPLLNPKLAIAFAARCARTSGSGHWRQGHKSGCPPR